MAGLNAEGVGEHGGRTGAGIVGEIAHRQSHARVGGIDFKSQRRGAIVEVGFGLGDPNTGSVKVGGGEAQERNADGIKAGSIRSRPEKQKGGKNREIDLAWQKSRFSHRVLAAIKAFFVPFCNDNRVMQDRFVARVDAAIKSAGRSLSGGGRIWRQSSNPWNAAGARGAARSGRKFWPPPGNAWAAATMGRSARKAAKPRPSGWCGKGCTRCAGPKRNCRAAAKGIKGR